MRRRAGACDVANVEYETLECWRFAFVPSLAERLVDCRGDHSAICEQRHPELRIHQKVGKSFGEILAVGAVLLPGGVLGAVLADGQCKLAEEP